MPWFKVSDDLHAHRKFDRVGLEEAGLWLKAGSYAAKYLTDGFVDDAWLARELPSAKKRARIVGKLIEERLFDTVEGGVRIHDYLSHNPSRAKLEELAEAKRRGGREGAGRRWGDRSSRGSTHDFNRWVRPCAT